MCYAFIANDIDVYLPDSDHDSYFIATRLLCKKCHAYWHMSLLECYICGELNYYLYTCTACGRKYSITNSSIKCECHSKDSKLIKACINENCPTNTNKELKAITMGEKGVFYLGSSFNLFLNHCVKCGEVDNTYHSFRIFVFNSQKDKDLNEFIIKYSVEPGDVILFKKHDGDKIKYDSLRITSLIKDNTYSPKYNTSDVGILIDKIFSGGSK